MKIKLQQACDLCEIHSDYDYGPIGNKHENCAPGYGKPCVNGFFISESDLIKVIGALRSCDSNMDNIDQRYDEKCVEEALSILCEEEK